MGTALFSEAYRESTSVALVGRCCAVLIPSRQTRPRLDLRLDEAADDPGRVHPGEVTLEDAEVGEFLARAQRRL